MNAEHPISLCGFDSGDTTPITVTIISHGYIPAFKFKMIQFLSFSLVSDHHLSHPTSNQVVGGV